MQFPNPYQSPQFTDAKSGRGTADRLEVIDFTRRLLSAIGCATALVGIADAWQHGLAAQTMLGFAIAALCNAYFVFRKPW